MSKGRLRVRLKGFDHRVVDQSAEQIVDVAVRTGAKIAAPVPLPTRTEKFTVLKGPHIDKRSREQFEIRTHNRVIDVLDPTSKTLDELSRLNLPAGVGIEIKM